MKKIELTKGQYAKVDDDDYEWLSKYKWYFSNGYATRYNGRINDKQNMVRMHREILSINGHVIDGKVIDHKDGDGLNNTKDNLRVCTQSQNAMNKENPSNNTSGYKGVSFSKLTNNWEAYITVRGKKLGLGYYNTPEEAAVAYDLAALDYYKEFAIVNFKDSFKKLANPADLQVINSNNNSGYRGVSFRSDNKKWRMDFQYFDKRQSGTFESAIEAAHEYDKLARKYLGEKARLNFPDYLEDDNLSLNLQYLIKSYYTQWIRVGKHKLPNLTDCLDFMMTEVCEAIDLRLRRESYVRNNPRDNIPTDEELGIEIFDAIMMGSIALDILGLDLQKVAIKKLEYMHKKRMG